MADDDDYDSTSENTKVWYSIKYVWEAVVAEVKTKFFHESVDHL